MNRDGSIKGRGCTYSPSKHIHTSKEDSIYIIVSVESLLFSCTIDSMVGRKVITVDIPGEFMQADMERLVHAKFEGIMLEMLVKIDPELYSRYEVMDQGQLVVYTDPSNPLYGTLRASLLFCKKLTANMVERVYKINPYDWCVANQTVQGSQFTVFWDVDNIKTSHLSQAVS